MNKAQITYRQQGKDDMYHIWHNFHGCVEFIYVHRGSGSIVFKNDIFPLHAGGLYLVGDGALHYTLPEHPETYVRSKLLIRSSRLYVLPELRHMLAECEGKYVALSGEAKDICERSFVELTSIDPTEPMVETLAAALAFRLAALLCSHHSKDFASPISHVTRVVDYINRNINNPITLDSICVGVGISKYYLCHHFKTQMKMTVMEYIHQTRIEFAKELLVSCPEISILEVSEICGFTNHSFFSQTFKRITGFSPKDFRLAHQPTKMSTDIASKS